MWELFDARVFMDKRRTSASARVKGLHNPKLGGVK
jgi:hypothetical protein